MAKYLNLTLSMTALTLATLAVGEELTDPTMPPPAFVAGTAETQSVGPMLQSVMLGEKRKAAIISGETVLLGKKFQGATLIKVTEFEAVLLNADGSRQVLSMQYPVDKKIVAEPALKTWTKTKQGSVVSQKTLKKSEAKK